MNNIPTDHPTLILVRGIPGSGKSYLANAIQAAYGQDKVVTLDPDATDYTSQEYLDFSQSLTDEGVDLKFHPYRFVRSKAWAAITDRKILIWNQAFTNLDGFTKTVVNLQKYAEEHNTTLPLLVVEVEAEEKTVKARVAARAAQGGHDVSEEAFERFFRDYKTFADQGYNPVVVHGEADVNVSVATVQKALQELWKK